MCAAESVSLQASLSVVGALECVVRRCVGPEGGSVLFIKDTGEMLITRHGQRILTTLCLDHPLARAVVECVSAHDHGTADGSKSFILLLAALLRGIHYSVTRHCQTSWNLANVRKLANQLLAFTCNELNDVVTHAVVPYTSCLTGLSGSKLEGGVLPALVGGYLAGRVSTGQAEILTPVLSEFYIRVSHDKEHTAQETITFLYSNFSQLYIAVSGLPSSQTHVVEGLVLACHWSVWTEVEGPVKALVVCESLDAELVCNEDINICFQEDWIVRSESVLQQKLARILCHHVNVLFSSVKQSERVVEWAGLNGISVLECCDSVQLDLLCELTTAKTLSLQPLLRVASLTHCTRLQVGGCRCANLGIPPYRSLHTYTLVLCAPTPGTLEQSVSVSRGVFAMLKHLSQSFLRTREQPNDTIPPNDSHNHHIQRDIVSQMHQSYYDNEQPHGTYLLPESQRSTLDLSRGLNFWDAILKAGKVVPVGGAFEFLLHHSLLHCSNHGDSESRWLLAEAILSIPKSLHSHSPRYFLQNHARFMSKLQILKQSHHNRELQSGLKFPFGLVPEGSGSLCLEPVCSKQQLVTSVVQCLNRLLFVGTILHTPTSLHKSTTVFEENEEEGM